jgi:tRNA-2-methylthio-N6-dimethylallyladenosine synthase
MRGCDNYCTYCVVPYVRGRETSRRPERIVDEVRDLAASGVREVVLLGQNVNSYGNKEGLCSFPRLLAKVNDVEGIERIRFTTSHPKDLSDELICSFGVLEKLCNHFHLPVQSGSSRILERMNRKYTRQQYMERVSTLRAAVENIAITTDIIVGFPGETPEDFEETVSLVREVGFDSIFAFMYSDRSPAPASKFSDKVPEDEKNRRLNRLLDLQKGITEKKNLAMVGETVSVLVEGSSKRASVNAGDSGVGEPQWSGRTTTNKVVNFLLPDGCLSEHAVTAGDLVRVHIERGLAHSLSGRAIVEDNKAMNTGENFHAA